MQNKGLGQIEEIAAGVGEDSRSIMVEALRCLHCELRVAQRGTSNDIELATGSIRI